MITYEFRKAGGMQL